MFGVAFGGVVFIALLFLSAIVSKVDPNTQINNDFNNILVHLGFAIIFGILAQEGLERAIEKIIKKNK